MRQLAPWQISSLIIGGAAISCFLAGFFGLPWRLTHHTQEYEAVTSTLISFGFSLLWVGVLVAAFIVLRRRGLWLLLGAPAGLFGPIALTTFMLYVSACQQTRPALECTHQIAHIAQWLRTFTG